MSWPHEFRKLMSGLSFLVGIVAFSVTGFCAETGMDCTAARQSLEAKRAKLSQYISSLKAFHRGGDWQLASALNHKIDQLIQEIRESEDALDCPERAPGKLPGGLSTVKTDVGLFVTSDCRELRNRLINLRRKINALKKLQQGIFSDGSPERQIELKKALGRLDDVKSALKAKCRLGRLSGTSREPKRGNLR